MESLFSCPKPIYFSLQFSLQAAMSLALVSSTNFWVMLATVGMSLIFYRLRCVYVCTARCLRRIDALGKLISFHIVHSKSIDFHTVKQVEVQSLAIQMPPSADSVQSERQIQNKLSSTNSIPCKTKTPASVSRSRRPHVQLHFGWN